MDTKHLKEIIQIFERSSVFKMTLKEKGGGEITLEKDKKHPEPEMHSALHPPARTPVSVAATNLPMPHETHPQPATEIPKPIVQEEKKEIAGHFVKSPMVGTFYRAASPDEKPYVEKGDKVTPDTVICIIEAMKVMNEVKAGKAGVVQKILVSDSDPVEFNSPLFVIE